MHCLASLGFMQHVLADADLEFPNESLPLDRNRANMARAVLGDGCTLTSDPYRDPPPAAFKSIC